VTKYRIPKQGGLGFDVLDLGPLQAQAQALQAALEAAQARIAALEAQPGSKSTTGLYDPAGTAATAVAAHVAAGGAAHGAASGATAGFMSAADFTKLAGVATGANNYTHPNHTGDVTSAGDGATTIVGNAVTNAKLADMATATIKGRTTAGTGDPEDLTAAQATALLNTFSPSLKGLAPASGGGTANFLRADGIWAAPSGGADPWTYLVLASDFVTSSATAVQITDGVTSLSFSPAPNSRYEFEFWLLTRTATTTVGPRPQITWPTPAQVDGVATLRQTSAAGTELIQNGNLNAAVLIPAGGLPNTTQSWPASGGGIIITGGTVTVGLRLQIASETAGTNVTVKAGSFLKYRAY
jgi:hypothetical protein